MKTCYKLMPWFLLGKQSIPKVPKIASSQWRFTISQKKLWMAFILCMQINIKVSTSWYYYFWWKWPHKSIATAFLFYCDAKHSGILRGPSLVVLGGCSQKWVHPFKLLNSKICFIYIYIYNVSRNQEWIDEMSYLLHVDINFWMGMLKMEIFSIMALYSQLYLTNHLINQEDRLNFCMLIVTE